MSKRVLILFLLVFALIFGSCDSKPEVTPTVVDEVPPSPTPTPSPPSEPTVLISEVQAGVDGNNNLDFIELYNTGTDAPIDLKGWSVWFKLADGQDEIPVIRWSEHTLIPPRGHYLLVRSGEDVGTLADAYFDQSLIGFKGGLQIRKTEGTVLDSLAWGDGPSDYAEGNLAPVIDSGYALERGLGGEMGNWADSADNAADFTLIPDPNPQNTGSPVTPEAAPGLGISVQVPETAEPGGQFDVSVAVSNNSENAAAGVSAQILIPLDFEVVAAEDGVEISDQAAFWGLDFVGNTHQVALWPVGDLATGETATAQITLSAPWTVFATQLANYSAQADGLPPVFGAPVRTSVEGGVIPIARLKDLVGSQMSIEGTVTIQTGALYAGGGNVKFYIEDETGGVQVWVPGGEGQVGVGIGAKVRVFGELTVYRGALELIVNDPADVDVLAGSLGSAPPPPTQMSISEAKNNPEYQGLLGQIEGLVARVEEFTYSYEIDLIDEAGETITLYVDKLTEINVESIEPGQFYKATGIVEIYNTEQQLYPRIQSDFERVYPPILAIEIDAPNVIATEGELEVAFTVFNHTPEPMTEVRIVGRLPNEGAQFVSASDGGDVEGSSIVWTIPKLEGNGSSATVRYLVRATLTDGFLVFDNYQATANEWEEPAAGLPLYVFVGDTVPIWAIQGPGDRSPYVLDPVTTAGIVTGIFSELGGFWIQEEQTDLDPLTSAGLFVSVDDLEGISVSAGDRVQISGIVRETSQQTQVRINNTEDIVVLEGGGPLPLSVELDPPPNEFEARDYYESVEGMLVQVSEPALAVSPQSKYGEYVLVLSRHGVDRLWQGDSDNNGLGIMVDDGSAEVHTNRSTLPYVVNAGDQVSKLIGPLAYTYGMYKIEPITLPEIVPGRVELPSLTPTGPDEFSIMTWNVENLFDLRDPHPSDPPMPTVSEYKASIAKVANTLVSAGLPTIVGLQEVENIGILEDIAEHESLAGYGYQPVLIEGTDSRGIDNGYLLRGEVASLANVEQHVAPEGLTSRPPLLIEVQIQTDSENLTVFVANNHFTSMSAGVEATEPRRNAQAAWNVTVLETVLEQSPGAYAAIIGDLNSFYDSLPIDTLREAGLRHVFEIIPEEERYSYIYQGASQTLDHILVTPSLFDLLQRTEVLHVNADYAPPEAGDESPMRKSDHDPVVAVFSLR